MTDDELIRLASRYNTQLANAIAWRLTESPTHPTNAVARGKQVEELVKAICSIVEGAGGYYIGRYRIEMQTAICDVLYGEAPVDLPSWPRERT